MGAQKALPRINEAAAYLNEYAPSSAASLEQRGGEVAELVRPGVYGGLAEEAVDGPRVGLSARADVLSVALKDAVSRSQRLVDKVEERLSLLKRVRFVSAVLAAVASSSVLPAAFAPMPVRIVAGILALGSSVAALSADTLVLGPNIKERDLTDTASTLQKVSGEGALTQRLLIVLSRTNYDVDEMRQILADANRLFGELMAALARIPDANIGLDRPAARRT